jgi:hypothetical protein
VGAAVADRLQHFSRDFTEGKLEFPDAAAQGRHGEQRQRLRPRQWYRLFQIRARDAEIAGRHRCDFCSPPLAHAVPHEHVFQRAECEDALQRIRIQNRDGRLIRSCFFGSEFIGMYGSRRVGPSVKISRPHTTRNLTSIMHVFGTRASGCHGASAVDVDANKRETQKSCTHEGSQQTVSFDRASTLYAREVTDPSSSSSPPFCHRHTHTHTHTHNVHAFDARTGSEAEKRVVSQRSRHEDTTTATRKQLLKRIHWLRLSRLPLFKLVIQVNPSVSLRFRCKATVHIHNATAANGCSSSKHTNDV